MLAPFVALHAATAAPSCAFGRPARFALVGPPGLCKRFTGGISARCGALGNLSTLHLCHLSKDSEDQLSNATSDGAEAMNV